MRIISWNISNRRQIWQDAVGLDADVALLQEAPRPSLPLPDHVEIDPSPWRTAGTNRHWKVVVVKLSDRVQVKRIEGEPISEDAWHDLAISRPGTLAVARVIPAEAKPLIVASRKRNRCEEHRSVL